MNTFTVKTLKSHIADCPYFAISYNKEEDMWSFWKPSPAYIPVVKTIFDEPDPHYLFLTTNFNLISKYKSVEGCQPPKEDTAIVVRIPQTLSCFGDTDNDILYITYDGQQLFGITANKRNRFRISGNNIVKATFNTSKPLYNYEFAMNEQQTKFFWSAKSMFLTEKKLPERASARILANSFIFSGNKLSLPSDTRSSTFQISTGLEEAPQILLKFDRTTFMGKAPKTSVLKIGDERWALFDEDGNSVTYGYLDRPRTDFVTFLKLMNAPSWELQFVDEDVNLYDDFPTKHLARLGKLKRIEEKYLVPMHEVFTWSYALQIPWNAYMYAEELKNKISILHSGYNIRKDKRSKIPTSDERYTFSIIPYGEHFMIKAVYGSVSMLMLVEVRD